MIKRNQIFSGMLFIITFLLGCTDEIQLKIKSEEPTIVVYGEIHNGKGPYTVRVQKPTNYGYQSVTDFIAPPIENAKVVISDDAGNTEQLMEQFPGVYVTKKEGIRGVVGRKYILTVEALGEKYSSIPEAISQPPKIDSVFNVFNYADNPRDYGHNISIIINDSKQEGDHYLIKHSSFNEFMIDQAPCYGTPPKCPEFFLRCWKYEQNATMILLNDKFTNGQSIKQQIAHAPLDATVDFATYITVQNGSRNLYNYWLRQDVQSKRSGSIFDVQPTQVLGNIFSTNGSKVALGYFAVTGMTRVKYIFNRFAATPLQQATKLIAYNADFRKRYVDYDCRNLFDYEWNPEKQIVIYPRKIVNNIGDKLPAWWYENDD